MKKLLLLTKLCVCVLIASCQNPQQSDKIAPLDENLTIDSKPTIKDSATMPSPAIKSEKQTTSVSAGTVGTEKTTKTDTAKTKPKNQPKAIIHMAPEQAKIDSIKNAKTKNKK